MERAFRPWWLVEFSFLSFRCRALAGLLEPGRGVDPGIGADLGAVVPPQDAGAAVAVHVAPRDDGRAVDFFAGRVRGDGPSGACDDGPPAGVAEQVTRGECGAIAPLGPDETAGRRPSLDFPEHAHRHGCCHGLTPRCCSCWVRSGLGWPGRRARVKPRRALPAWRAYGACPGSRSQRGQAVKAGDIGDFGRARLLVADEPAERRTVRE